jgi:dolichol kinase
VILPFLLNFPFKPKFQVQRRLLHMMTGSLIVFLSTKETGEGGALWQALFMLTLGAGVIEYSRRKIPGASKLFAFFFGNLLRPEEASKERIPGAFYFLPGAGLCLYLFPQRLARLGILALGFGDPFAGFCGGVNHRLNLRFAGKSLFGFLGCTVAAGVACAAFEGSSQVKAVVKFGVIAGVAESVSFLDDNLTMPTFFCLLLSLVEKYIL